MTPASEFLDVPLTVGGNAANTAALLPDRKMLGPKPPPRAELPADICGMGVTLRIGRAPLALDLAQLYTATGRDFPPEYDAASPHRLVLLMFTVGVLNEGSFERIRRFGLRVMLPPDPRYRIFDLLPRQELLTRFEANLEGRANLECRADLGIDGQVELPAEASPLPLPLGLPFGVSAAAGVTARVIGRLSFAVHSRLVDAIGDGDTQAQWVLTRQDLPLDGRTHRFGMVVSVPVAETEVKPKVNVYAIVSRLSSLHTWPVRLEDPDWHELKARIEGPPPAASTPAPTTSPPPPAAKRRKGS